MSTPTIVVDRGVRIVALPSPILAVEVLRGLADLLRAAAGEPGALVVRSTHAEVFLAGAHLAEIAALSAASSGPYARLGREVLELLQRHPGPVVAAVQGACLGGGVDLVLACDTVIAGPAARFGHPGVRRGLVTGWGGTARWPEVLGGGRARLAFLTGASVPADDAFRAGWVSGVADDPLAAASAEARRLTALHPSRLSAWRRLRAGRFIDRFRGLVVHNSRKSRDFSARESR